MKKKSAEKILHDKAMKMPKANFLLNIPEEAQTIIGFSARKKIIKRPV